MTKTDPQEFDKFIELIPDEVRDSFYFIPVRRDKGPDVLESDSWKNEKYHLDAIKARARLENGRNVGIVFTGRGLLCIDVDNPSKLLPPKSTLIVETRSGKPHLYYVNGGDIKNKDWTDSDEGNTNIGEVRAENRYVLAPGSYVPVDDSCLPDATGVYRIMDPRVPAVLFAKDLPEKLQGGSSANAPQLQVNALTTWRNNKGKTLDYLRSKDKKLDELLNGGLAGKPSQSEADQATLCKLLFYGYDEGEAVAIFTSYRNRDKLKRKDYIARTLEKAKQWVEQNPPALSFAPPVEPIQYDSHEKLFLQVRRYIMRYVDLFNEKQYDVLAAKAFESWIVELLTMLGYVFFIGPHGSGKTRAEETLEKLCKDSLFAATMTGAALYRALEEFKPTMFFDEVQQYLKDDRQGFIALLNAGQRRAQKAYIMVRSGEGFQLRGFEVFGSKFLASTQTTVATLASRCIVINMYKAPRRMPLFFDEEEAEEIRGKLKKWADDTIKAGLPRVEEIFSDFRDNRTVEAFINLVAVTPTKYRPRIIEYAKEVENEIMQNDQLSFYAELYEAVNKAVEVHKATNEKSVPPDVVMIGTVKECWDADHPNDPITPQTIGREMTVMGVSKKYRNSSTGLRGRYAPPGVLIRLAMRYDPDYEPQQELED